MTLEYRPGDIFVFLTDGFTEAMNENLQPYGEENLCRLVRENASLTAEALMERIIGEIKYYSAGRWFDDATGVVVKIRAAARKQ